MDEILHVGDEVLDSLNEVIGAGNLEDKVLEPDDVLDVEDEVLAMSETKSSIT